MQLTDNTQLSLFGKMSWEVRGLTQKERDAQIIEQEIQRASQDFLNVAREKRGREDKTYAQVAEDIGVSNILFKLLLNAFLHLIGLGVG